MRSSLYRRHGPLIISKGAGVPVPGREIRKGVFYSYGRIVAVKSKTRLTGTLTVEEKQVLTMILSIVYKREKILFP